MSKNTNSYPKVMLFSDGGSEPNPGVGGFGVILSYKGVVKEFMRGYSYTTNNRMELMAVIFGLESLNKKSSVTVVTDSKYVIDPLNKGWAVNWKKNGWKKKNNKKVLNSDLWEKLLYLIGIHDVEFKWVKGHSGHKENERCDELASLAINGEIHLDDIWYVNENKIQNVVTKSKGKDKKKTKVKKVGDLCKKCNEPVEKKIPKRKKLKPGQKYYFEYYLLCPVCKTMYMIESAKVYVT